MYSLNPLRKLRLLAVYGSFNDTNNFPLVRFPLSRHFFFWIYMDAILSAAADLAEF